MKKSLVLLAGAACVAQLAQAGQPIRLRQGESRRLVLNDGRSVVVSCSQSGGRQTSLEYPLAAGRSIQLTMYRESSPTTISCDNFAPRPQPPRPQPPRPQPPIPQPQPPRPLPPIPQPLPPQPIPGRGTEVVIFSNSDSCSGNVAGYANLQAGLDVTDQCRSQLANANASAWSIRVDGVCRDISDTNALSACAQTIVPQRRDDVQVTIFSNSDSCSGNVSASGIFNSYRSQAEQCNAMAARGNGSAWSIRIGNSCQDISDTNVLSACMGMNLPNSRPNGATDAVFYSNSDSCSGNVSGSASLLADYDLQDQCNGLTRTGSSSSAWSVKVEGVCRDITDTDLVSACLNVRVPSYRGARQVVIYSNSDSCSGAVSAAGYIDPRYSTLAQCQALKSNGGRTRAWSIRVDDRCIDVSDTDYVSACMNVQF
ncbi:MAG: hypothetical protein JST04_04570 [Bdellovibrionales bacterium]|nr:hypothetical protein [Bdellovibrionales bacterium]